MTACPVHPEKVQFVSMIDALDALQVRFSQANSRIKRTYKCQHCNGWHFTSQQSRWRPTFLIPTGWFMVIVNESKVWQSQDEAAADRKAKALRGRVVASLGGTNL